MGGFALTFDLPEDLGGGLGFALAAGLAVGFLGLALGFAGVSFGFCLRLSTGLGCFLAVMPPKVSAAAFLAHR